MYLPLRTDRRSSIDLPGDHCTSTPAHQRDLKRNKGLYLNHLEISARVLGGQQLVACGRVRLRGNEERRPH
jgi:hypothetical protein